MTMKKYLLVVTAVLLCSIAAVQAQTPVTINVPNAGDLATNADLMAPIVAIPRPTHLTLTGTINQKDFAILKTYLTSSLQSIDLSSVTIKAVDRSLDDELPSGAFSDFTQLSNVVLPANLKHIGNVAFFQCTNLTELTLPTGLKYISGIQTFQNAGLITLNNIPENLEILSSVNSSGIQSTKIDRMFLRTKLSSFRVPANVTEIEEYSFPSNAREDMGPGSLKSLTFAPNSQLLTFTVLFRVRSLAELILPEGLKKIEAFSSLNSLKKIELPSTLETITGVYSGIPFFGAEMDALQTIVSHAVLPPTITAGTTFAGIPDKKKVTLYVPKESVEGGFYQGQEIWKEFTIKAIGEGGEQSAIQNFESRTVETGSEPIRLEASVEDGREITYSVKTPNDAVATLDPATGIVTINGEGSIEITATAPWSGEYAEATKTITLAVVDYSWLQAPAIAIHDKTALVVGPDADKFTKFQVGTGTPTDGNSADISTVASEVELKATTANGDVVKLRYKK